MVTKTLATCCTCSRSIPIEDTAEATLVSRGAMCEYFHCRDLKACRIAQAMNRSVCAYEGNQSLAMDDVDVLQKTLSACRKLLQEFTSAAFDNPADPKAARTTEAKAARLIAAINH